MNQTKVFLATLVVGTACGTEPIDIERTASALPPPGHNAAPVTPTANDIPTAMNPGERLNVRVTMANTGATVGLNSWAANTHYLYSRNSPLAAFGFVSTLARTNVDPGQSYDFDMVITAPTTPGTYNFAAQMYQGGEGFFGAQHTVPNIVVNAATPRRWACEEVTAMSTIPTLMAPGEVRAVSVTVRNTGTATWSPPSLCLYSRDNLAPTNNLNFWTGANCMQVPAAVAPNATHTFNFTITAPATPGTYPLRRQIFDGKPTSPTGGVGFFDLTNFCVNRNILVSSQTDAYAALFEGDTLPATMAPGERRRVTVSVRNAGSQTWNPNQVYLYSRNTPITQWGVVSVSVPAQVAPGALATFSYIITAPTTPGDYQHRWQMFNGINPNAGFFGAIYTEAVNVSAANQPELGAAVVAQAIPASIPVGGQAQFQITMQNSGSLAWNNPDVELISTNTPANLWTTSLITMNPAETVAPGGTRQFTFTVRAPAVAGTYASSWRMRSRALGSFGETALTANIVVGVGGCGNTVIEAGETCDDGNVMPNDGCSATCQLEPRTVDLAAVTNRLFAGTTNAGQMGTVAIGEFSGDATQDIVVGEAVGANAMGMSTRVFAGTLYGYAGGAGFFSGDSTAVPTDAIFQILGAEANDRLGGGFLGNIEIADITGDGRGDVIAAAPGADGIDNLTANAGEVFVFDGALLTGFIDARTATVGPTATYARIIGPAAGAQLTVLGAADFDGDTFQDLILGAPFASPNGRNESGAIYIVRGGAALDGATVELSAGVGGLVLAVVQGALAGDRLGQTAGAGDFAGGAQVDLAVGARDHTPGGLTRAGGAWALFGPVTGTYDLAANFSARWIGGDNTSQLGTSVRVGNVAGDARADLVIGGDQLLNPNLALPDAQRGRVDVWRGPILAGTYDLGAGATANTRIFGVEYADLFGRAVALGEANGDGFMDIYASAYGADGPGNARNLAGEAFLVLGGTTQAATIDLAAVTAPIHVFGPTESGLMGRFQKNIAVGDLDGDGRADVCLGTPNGGVGRVDCVNNPF